MRILVLVPISGLSEAAVEERMVFLRSIAGECTELDRLQLREGPPAIECPVDHLQASAEVIKHVKWAEDEGFDASVLSEFRARVVEHAFGGA